MNAFLTISDALDPVFARAQRWVNDISISISEARARRAVYVRMLNELSAMSDRDLADLGITRLNFREIARDAAYGQ
jgi:uncharacterized protein YjiS (DUF1127 family)